MPRIPLSQTWTLLNIVIAIWVLFSLSQAEAAILRPSVSVAGEHITLGDLFDDAGAASSVIIAIAPPPGVPTAISVSRISQVARRNGIAWRNTQGLTRVVVTRSGILIGDELIEEALAASIAEQAPNMVTKGIIEIVLTSSIDHLMVSESTLPSMSVGHMNFDQRSGRFIAAVRVPANDNTAPLRRLTGRAYPALDIPVLTRRISPGDKIEEADINWLRLPATRISQNIIDNANDLIGFTPKRTLRPGEPLRGGDIEAPRLVEKGAIVSISYTLGRMNLSSRGRALEEGALGDTIKVLNERSHRTIEVKVTGMNEAIIEPSYPVSQAVSSAQATTAIN